MNRWGVGGDGEPDREAAVSRGRELRTPQLPTEYPKPYVRHLGSVCLAKFDSVLSSSPMAAPADLSKLRIDRSAPPAPVKRALRRNLIIFGVAVLVVAVTFIVLRAGAVPVVQVASATAAGSGSGAGGTGGATSVTANGYVVARTKASVSAKTAGRLAFLGVSEGSYVNRGQIIARLDNADFQASVAQAQANVATADASVIEATAERDQSERDAGRIREIRTRNPNLMSEQDLETYTSRATGALARYNAAIARKRSAEAALRL